MSYSGPAASDDGPVPLSTRLATHHARRLVSEHRCVTMTPELYVTSQHHLRVEMRPDEGSSPLPAATSARIERAFNDGAGAGLLHLATTEIKTTLGVTLAFARGFAQRYFTQLCHLGEPDVSQETELIVPPG